MGPRRRPATPTALHAARGHKARGYTRNKLSLLLFAFALGIRAMAIALSGFDGLYGQDAFAYVDYAQALQRALASFEPPPSFHWPIGYPLLVALTTTAVGSGAQAAQWVSVVTGALVAPLIHALVCALRPQAWRGALIAALLAATAPQLLLSSLCAMSDAAALFWITLSAWALVRYQGQSGIAASESSASRRRNTLQMWVLAVLALGMAILTRWLYVVAIPVWGLSTFLAWREARVAVRDRIADSVIALVVVLFVVGSQFAGDLSHGRAPHVGSFQVAGWNPSNAFHSTVINSDGIIRYDWPVGIFYALPLLHPSFVFPLLSLYVVVGGVEIARGVRSMSALFIGWPLGVYLYLAGRAWENPRFSLGLFAPLLVLLGIGFERAIGAAHGKWRAAVVACAVLAIFGSLAWNVRTVGRFVAVKDAQLATVRWVESATPPQATIVSFGLTYILQHYTGRPVVNLYEVDPEVLAARISSASLEYLLIDPGNLEDQWRGKSPALNVEWLRNNAKLAEVGRRSPWVLFKIEPR